MESSGNNSSLEVPGCAGSLCPLGCMLRVATCVGVRPTLPPRFPSCNSYHVPHDGWTHSSALRVLRRLTSSSCHPSRRPGACQAALDVGQRSTASQQPSGPWTTPGRALHVGCLPVELVEKVWANARGLCGSAGLWALSHSLEPPSDQLGPRDVCRICKIPVASPGPASPLPRKRGRGSSFHNKSPAWGSCGRLKLGPRC